MSGETLSAIEFGEELDTARPDTSLTRVRAFAEAVGWRGARFEDHEAARAEGLPGALVPGIMAMGFFTAMIHRWAPDAWVEQIDTVFRAPMLADQPVTVDAVVTDIDEETQLVELDLTVKNDAGETRVFGTAKVRFSP